MNADSRRDSQQALKASHTPDEINRRLSKGPSHSYLRDFIYGAIDGAVTTLAVISGVAGAGLSNGVVIVMGAANLVADGFSMAAGNFLGTRAEDKLREAVRGEEHHHIKTVPEGEKEEIRQIFFRKGFEGEDLERIVSVITSDPDLWVDTMMQDEMGLALEGANPFRAAVTTFTAFIIVGFVPLFSFVVNYLFGDAISHPFLLSVFFTAGALFAVGALQSRYVAEKWQISGLETLAIGGGAAGVAYFVGLLLKGLV